MIGWHGMLAAAIALVALSLGCDRHSTDSHVDSNITWSATFGGPGDDQGYDICRTDDGRIFVVGSSKSAGATSSNLYALILDTNGEAVTDTQLQFSGSAGAAAATPAGAGTVAVAGVVDGSALFLKLDSVLTPSCQHVYHPHGQSSTYTASDLCQSTGGGYLLVGGTSHIQPPTPPHGDVLVIQTDARGNHLNTLSYSGGEEFGHGTAITLLDGREYALVGSTSSMTRSCEPGRACDASDRIVSGLTATPDTLWHLRVPGESGESAHDVLPVTDGILVVGGDGSDIWLGEFSSTGEMKWSNTLAEVNSTEWALGAAKAHDGGYLLVGNSRTSDWSDTDAILVKTDLQGNELWRRRFGGPSQDCGRAVITMDDGGFMFVGETSSFGAGGSDVWVVRGDPDGRVVGM